MDILFMAVAAVAAYLVGSIPFGFLIGKLYDIDIRTVGSKNIGATNVTRTVGKTAGKVCFFLDFIKGALPVLAVQFYGGKFIENQPDWLVLVVMAAAIVGHMFPVFLNFKGGKGVSTAAGAILALAPYPLLVAFVVWVVIFFISRYVSVASITAAVVLPVVAWVFRWTNFGSEVARSIWTLCFLTAISLLTVIRHHGNIRRLLNGTETRFGRKQEDKSPDKAAVPDEDGTADDGVAEEK